jgi:hypothetical protein
MKITRLAGLLLGALLAMSLIAASTASAALPEFRPAAGKFLALFLATTFNAGPGQVRCKEGSSSGSISNAHLVGPFDITFTTCESSINSTTFCPVNSVGANAGEILTTTLHGVLGLALASQLVGLLILPTAGKTIARLSQNGCTPETEVLGSVAGLVSPVRTLTLFTSLTFDFSLGQQIPNSLDTLGGLIEPRLDVLGVNSLLKTVVHIKWHTDIEIR